jgi:hypothetical protein
MTTADIVEDDSAARVDETTALLAPSATQKTIVDGDNEGQPLDSAAGDTPLPKNQIILLCFARFIEPLAFFCIFPFINQMIFETGEVAETDVGFYSGLIVCFLLLTDGDTTDPMQRNRYFR